MDLQCFRLGTRQGDICSGWPCSPISMLEGDLFLAYQSTLPPQSEVEHRVRMGCDLWSLLTSEARRSRGIRVAPDEYLMPMEVVKAVVDQETQLLRWKVLAEYTGLHATGETPPWVTEFMNGIANTHVDEADKGRDDIAEFRVVDSIDEALEKMSELSDARQETVAGALTYGVHTVMIAVTYVNTAISIYSAIDSLTGMWYSVPTNLCLISSIVCKEWCHRHVWPTMTQTESEASVLSTFNSPGTFLLTVFAINKPVS